MDALDPIVLARLQFAANITFHILFPTFTHRVGVVFALFSQLDLLSRACSIVWMPTGFGSRFLH